MLRRVALKSLRRFTSRVVGFGLVAICAVAVASGGQALAYRPHRVARAAGPATNYRIFKIYVSALAARARVVLASNNRVDSLVLRYGNRNWGLDHLKAKHDWGSDLDKAMQYLVTDPKTKVRAEGGNSYRWDDTQWFKGELCGFRVIENRTRLSDGYEKGIITAYPLAPCGDVFL
jgi:hypothetical protein